MDIKEANIFVKDGIWFVGDFGACVNVGDNVRETTGGCYILPREEVINKPSTWHHDWFALALVFVNQLNVHEGPIESSVNGFKDRVHEWIDTKLQINTKLEGEELQHEELKAEELKALLHNMVDCREQLMQLAGEDDVVILTDEL
jgi:hypothetical protein